MWKCISIVALRFDPILFTANKINEIYRSVCGLLYSMELEVYRDVRKLNSTIFPDFSTISQSRLITPSGK